MKTLLRILRAIFLGIIIGGCVAVVIYKRQHTDRLTKVRARVESSLKQDLTKSGFTYGDQVFIRIFKDESELELWLKPVDSDRFKRWKTWPVAGMSGNLGPKLKEGDRQAPEGFYRVNLEALNPMSNYHLSFNLGYPNEFDIANGCTGSFIMVHGSVLSIGCFAMTDPVIEQIYLTVEAALKSGQKDFPVHIFPFRMSPERFGMEPASPWTPFWFDLKAGYDAFEQTGIPPIMKVADKRYAITQ